MSPSSRLSRASAARAQSVSSAPQSALSSLTPVARLGTASGGQTLERPTERAMSARFGHDFSQVRIHTDVQAGQSARALGAKAFTVGNEIVFGDEEFQPGSPDGERLLAHELAHIVQQDRFGAESSQALSRPGDAAEREAEQVSANIADGQPATVEAAPTARLFRSVADDVGSFFSGAAGFANKTAQVAADGVTALAGPGMAAQGVALSGHIGAPALSGVGGPVIDAVPEGTGEAIYNFGRDWVHQEEEDARPYVEGINAAENAVNQGITYGENKEHDFTSSIAKDHPWLGPLAQDLDDATQFVGGVGRSATGTVGGVAKMATDPVGTVDNVATLASHLDDPEYLKKTLLGPYQQQWAEGKYMDVFGHAAGDIFTLLAPGGEAEGAAREAGAITREGEGLAREAGGVSRETESVAKDPWGDAGGSPPHEPPGGGGGGGGGGRRPPQSIPEMIQEEVDKAKAQLAEHPGAGPLNPAEFDSGPTCRLAPEGNSSLPNVPSTGFPLDPLSESPVSTPNPSTDWTEWLQSEGYSPEEVEAMRGEIDEMPDDPGPTPGSSGPRRTSYAKDSNIVNHGRSKWRP